MRALSPSLREKKRYIAFKIHADAPIQDFSLLRQTIQHSIERVIGELDAGNAGIWIVPDAWDGDEQKGLIRVNTKYVDKLLVSLALIDRIGTQTVAISGIGISGIMKKAQGRYIAG